METAPPIDRTAELNEFRSFQKISRLRRLCIVTEKVDGTNGQIVVYPDGTVRAGSRNRYLTPESDSFGFAKWAIEHADELRSLGEGRHYGEWWGCGIQRGYGLKEKRFSLFNTSRWFDPTAVYDNCNVHYEDGPAWSEYAAGRIRCPACCTVVPVLRFGNMNTVAAAYAIARLKADGSVAAPGFMRPEGIVMYHTASNTCFKQTIEGDEVPKSTQNADTANEISRNVVKEQVR